jgi:hypothetical protein
MKRISACLLVGALVVAIPATTLVAAKEKEKRSLERVFRMADANGDSRLSLSEVASTLTGENEQRIRDIFKKLDRNGDRRLTLQEYERGKDEKSRDHKP